MKTSVTLPDLAADEGIVPLDTADGAPEAAAVVVGLSGSRYAVPMASVAEVGRIPHVTRVPGVPGWVAGVANWRGRILPVVDLRPLLGGEAAPIGAANGPANAQGRLVVAGDDTVSLGLLVEAVDGVAVPPADLEPAPATVGPDAAELLAGQWTDESGPVGLVDVRALLRLRDRLPRRGD
jgi:purine-binding chemotaxis protein CheW